MIATALTRRVRAASPGGSSTQPSGAVSTFPSAERTVFGVGPGVKVLAAIPLLPSWRVHSALVTEQDRPLRQRSATSHSLIVRSKPPEANVLPSGPNATE